MTKSVLKDLIIPYGASAKEIRIKSFIKDGSMFQEDVGKNYYTKITNDVNFVSLTKGESLKILRFFKKNFFVLLSSLADKHGLDIEPDETKGLVFEVIRSRLKSVYKKDVESGELKNIDVIEPILKEIEVNLVLVKSYFKKLSQTTSEERFVELYITNILETLENNGISLFGVLECLAPLPQAQLNFQDESMCIPDFLFFTGDQIIVVEIDSGKKPSEGVINKDRTYKKFNVEYIRLTNAELEETTNSGEVFEKYLPKELQITD